MAYTSFGHSTATEKAHMAFTGQRRECQEAYMLGNGRRMYCPILMRFTQPDRYSPFEKGGLNAYAYCMGQPVSQSDPTGNSPLLHLFRLGILQTTLFGGLTIATAVAADSEPVTTALGITTAVFALGTFAVGARLARSSRRRISTVAATERELSSMEAVSEMSQVDAARARASLLAWLDSINERLQASRSARSSNSLRAPVPGPSRRLSIEQQRPPSPVINYQHWRGPRRSSTNSGIFESTV
ncbi:RHS repeat-associated core domain-containing protein [Pseudomonas sp. Marseille-Q5115]|uniref:RHS repeat-associated core domain-containing protein n=1 Tax=Pseudomonas sp. Marseille-Q5115 TaxID=2866593 RepID=UPI001CE472DA